jgi:hypothetical protein
MWEASIFRKEGRKVRERERERENMRTLGFYYLTVVSHLLNSDKKIKAICTNIGEGI